MRKYTLLRLSGEPIQSAYKLAGYKGKRDTKAAYRVEERTRKMDPAALDALESGKITNRVLLDIGLAGIRRLFDDYLNDRPNANAPAVVKLIKMQQDRIDPVPTKKKVRSHV